MKKIICGIFLALTAIAAFPDEGMARTKEDNNIVKEISGGLPVYMGNGMTWNKFDIDDQGQFVIGLISQNLPDVSGMTDEIRASYRDLLVGPKSGYVNLARSLGRSLRINVYNQQGELCISESVTSER
ncbi:MAG: hypothetical protein K2J70_06065 [Muribaculaceae bacterium]|nr:hypothetical protein [Muribaculaceae bacterium]